MGSVTHKHALDDIVEFKINDDTLYGKITHISIAVSKKQRDVIYNISVDSNKCYAIPEKDIIPPIKKQEAPLFRGAGVDIQDLKRYLREEEGRKEKEFPKVTYDTTQPIKFSK